MSDFQPGGLVPAMKWGGSASTTEPHTPEPRLRCVTCWLKGSSFHDPNIYIHAGQSICGDHLSELTGWLPGDTIPG